MNCFQLGPKGLSYDTLISHLPRGVAWLAARVPGKNLYQLWHAFAEAYEDATEALCKLPVELNPYTTTELITEWETAVGLPDACLPKATTLEERRKYVVFRLTKRRWSTEQDWKDLALLFGLTITVTPGWHVQRPALFDKCFDSIFWEFERLGRFHVFVDIFGGCSEGGGFNYDFDYPFATETEACEQFKCILERVKPANVVIIWNEDPVGNGWLTCGS